MAVKINDPAYPHLPYERSVVIGDRDGRIQIHPWDRGGVYGAGVAVSLGRLNGNGDPKHSEGDDWMNGIFLREDFVEGLLAVLPELVRR